MASASETLEEHLSCPVCFEIFRDPHELRCRHTFCLQCIKQIQKGPSIECPECRKKTNQNEVNKDFKSQRLIDSLTRQQQESIKRRAISVSTDKKNTKCEMCNNASKPIKYNCEDCDQLMCANCQTTHQGIKLCRNHTVKPVKEIVTSMQSTLKKTVTDLKQEERNVLRQCGEVDKSMQEIQQQESIQMADVDSCIDSIIQEANKHREQVKQEIREVNAGIVDNLAISKQVFNKSHKQIKGKIDFLTEMASCEDVATLKEIIGSIDANIHKEVQSLKSKYPVMKSSLKSPVVVNKAGSWSPKSSVWISVVQQLQQDVQDFQKPAMLYTDLTDSTYQMEKEVDGFCNAFGLCMINNTIWCGEDRGIKIFTKEGKLMKTIEHEKICAVRCLTKCDTDHIIVGCDGNKGMHILDLSGNYLRKLADGTFTGVTFYHGQIYALKYGSDKLHAFMYNNAEDTPMTTKPLGININSRLDKLVVQNDQMFVSNENKLHIYNTDLKLLKRVGQKGSGPVGDFQNITVCGIDDAGNALLADYNNHRIQVYKKEGGWQILKLPTDKLCLPLNVVVDPHTKDIWITQHNDKLLKFTLKSKIRQKYESF